MIFRASTRPLLLATAAALLASLAACSSVSLNPAPVEDRGAVPSGQPYKPSPVAEASPQAGQSVGAPPVKLPPGAENAGKPGYYTVKRGDTLIRIGLDTGQSHKDIARWNGLDNPNRIEEGQVLRIVTPVATETVLTKPVSAGSVVSNTLPSPSSTALPPLGTESAPVAAPVAAPVGDDVAWIWPSSGNVLAGFDDVKNKGLDISGAAGDAVLAAADGRVVYAGTGLRGYGNLIILKHNNLFLSAYAHNQTLLVKEDQAVKKGQKIAEMGNTDADRVKLHFEVRKGGKPVDPSKYLPAR